MERIAQGKLLLFVNDLESAVISEEKVVCERIKKDSFYSIHEIISSIRNYAEWIKISVFDEVVSSTYKREINIKEFNEINDCLNKEFNSIEELKEHFK